MSHGSRIFLVGVLALAQAACVQLAEVDATSSAIFAPMIGREFELKADFLLQGIKLPPKFDEVSYLLAMPPPGIYSTFRIADLGRLPAGTRIRIAGAVTHRSELFPSTEYVITVAGHDFGAAAGKPVRLQAAASWHLYVAPASPGAAPSLSGQFFRPIEGPRP